MALQSFTDNYEDNSTEAGFQFTFYCDLCREGFKSTFIESKTYKRSGLFRGLGRAISVGTSLLGSSGITDALSQGSDILSERFEGMSPEWHREHEAAFAQAQSEAKRMFHRCPKCKQWVCDNDWNEQEGLCVDDAPRVNVEVAAARGQKMAADIQEKAASTRVFTGEIESKQTICPKCGKPAGEGKFCSNCGTRLGLIECQVCGTGSPAGTRFCPECGNRLGGAA
ncbi:MAG: zinc ribbon domain-containing protein [Anaerolineae bacterium]|nr:zinc ribbon domain-containing protein [Anaerolineae bacterium]